MTQNVTNTNNYLKINNLNRILYYEFDGIEVISCEEKEEIYYFTVRIDEHPKYETLDFVVKKKKHRRGIHIIGAHLGSKYVQKEEINTPSNFLKVLKNMINQSV